MKANNEGRFEFSVLLVKPNAVRLGLVGILRQEVVEAGFDIAAEGETLVTRKIAEEMYQTLSEKKEPVIDHIISGPCYAFVVIGNSTIAALREFAGHTKWKNRPAKGLRGKYSQDYIRNSVHTPDSHKEVVEELRKVIPHITHSLLDSQLADELACFLVNEERINSGERILSQYSV